MPLWQAGHQEHLLENTDDLDLAPITRACAVRMRMDWFRARDGGTDAASPSAAMTAHIVVMPYPGLDRFGRRILSIDEVCASPVERSPTSTRH